MAGSLNNPILRGFWQTCRICPIPGEIDSIELRDLITSKVKDSSKVPVSGFFECFIYIKVPLLVVFSSGTFIWLTFA